MFADCDEHLRTLLADLNAAGYVTFSSCQGKRSLDDFAAGRHYDHAVVSFAEAIPAAIKRRAHRFGLVVYNGGVSICPDYPDGKPETYVARNIAFPAAMRLLFNLSPEPPLAVAA